MKNIIIAFLFIIVFMNPADAVTDRPYTYLNSPLLLEQPSRSEFTFGVFGDFRPSRRDMPYPSPYWQILEEMAMIGPSFVVSLGDAYFGYGGSFQRFRNEVDYFLSTIKPLAVPFFHVIGNHEVTDDRERDEYVKRHFGNSYGSFDSGVSHFVVLDTEEKGSEGTIAGEQLKWLEKDLDANVEAQNIFIFLHRPLFSKIDPDGSKGASSKDKAGRDALHSIFVKHHVKAVFAGHEHLFSDMVRDGIRYLIAGGGGAPLYSSPQDSGFFHYLLVTVADGDIRIDVISPYSIHVRTLYNNFGIEPRAELELANNSNTDIHMSSIAVKMPRSGTYHAKAVSISSRGEIKDYEVLINSVKDNGDGTSTLGIGTLLPRNGVLRITVEADF